MVENTVTPFSVNVNIQWGRVAPGTVQGTPAIPREGYTFLAVQSYRYELEAEVAEYPIEASETATLSDHYRYNPPNISFTVADWQGQDPNKDTGIRELGEIRSQLEKLRNLGALLKVTTPSGTFNQCVITSITQTKDAPRGTQEAFAVTFRQIIVAEFLPVSFQYLLDPLDNKLIGIAPLSGTRSVTLSQPVSIASDEDSTWAEESGEWMVENTVRVSPIGGWHIEAPW